MLGFLAEHSEQCPCLLPIHIRPWACCTLQGTNAHAIMNSAGAASSVVPSHAELQWQRRRLWLAPTVSLLTERAMSSGRDTVVMTCNAGAVHQRYLWDHQVRVELSLHASPDSQMSKRTETGSSPD